MSIMLTPLVEISTYRDESVRSKSFHKQDDHQAAVAKERPDKQQRRYLAVF